MFEAIPLTNIGLEWEPTHQMTQLIDPMPQLQEWGKRIFHLHGKDANVRRDVIAKYGLDGLPVLAAGEVSCRADIEKFLKMGYDGVQIGTYFITTEEAWIDARSKQVFIDAKAEDIVVIKSPVGLPVRVLKTPLVQRVLSGNREPFKCPYRCLRSCNPAKSLFCIAQALIATWRGDVERGLYMVVCNVEACRKIYPVKEFFDTLAGE